MFTISGEGRMSQGLIGVRVRAVLGLAKAHGSLGGCACRVMVGVRVGFRFRFRFRLGSGWISIHGGGYRVCMLALGWGVVGSVLVATFRFRFKFRFRLGSGWISPSGHI